MTPKPYEVREVSEAEAILQPREIVNPKKEAELADSLVTHGQLVNAVGVIQDGKVLILQGNTRGKHLFKAGKPLRVEIRDDLDTQEKRAQFALAEANRSDLHPVEKAGRLLWFIDGPPARPQNVAAKLLGMSEAGLSRALAPMKMCPPILAAWQAGRITAHHVVVLKKEKDEGRRLELLKEALEGGLSARELAKRIGRKTPRGKTDTVKAGRLVVTCPAGMNVGDFDADVKLVRAEVARRAEEAKKALLKAAKETEKARMKVAEVMA